MYHPRKIARMSDTVKSLYDPDAVPAPKTHEQKMETRLGWVVFFTGIVAAGVVANFIAGIVIGATL